MPANALGRPESVDRAIPTPNQYFAKKICDFLDQRGHQPQSVRIITGDWGETVSETAEISRLEDRELDPVIQIKILPENELADMRVIQITVTPNRYLITACQSEDRELSQPEIDGMQRNKGGIQHFAIMCDLQDVSSAIKRATK